jgi:hypothetical protein
MNTATVVTAFVFGIWLAMLAVACGGEGEPTPSGSPAASPSATEQASPTWPAASPTLPAETRAELEALLRSMCLKLEDLPSGFTLQEERFTTNEEAARDYLDGEEQGLADYTRWGRLLGYEATYSTEVSLATLATGGTIYIAVRPTLFEDSKGASEAMEKAKERLSDPEEKARFVEDFRKDSNWEDVELAPMSFAQVGDDSTAFQLTGKVSLSESAVGVTAVAQVVAIRRGRGNGMVIVSAIQGPSPIQELEAMVRKLDQRMKEALE